MDKEDTEFYFNVKAGKPMSPCKSCRSIQTAEYRKNNAEKIRVGKVEYYNENKPRIQAGYKKWQNENREHVRKYQRDWGRNNVDKKRGYARKALGLLKAKVFNHYGPFCACCGEDIPQFLTIDHVNNDGAAHRRDSWHGSKIYQYIVENDYPDTFQVLCMNCNFGKYMNGGVCPHEELGNLQRLSERSTPQAIGGGSAKPYINIGEDIVRSTWKHVAVAEEATV